MRFNFRGVYILRICNFRVFRVFKFAVAGCSGVEIFAGEIFADIQSEPVYHNTVNILKIRKSKVRKLAAILSRHALKIRFIGRL